jgi:hypothetical protein
MRLGSENRDLDPTLDYMLVLWSSHPPPAQRIHLPHSVSHLTQLNYLQISDRRPLSPSVIFLGLSAIVLSLPNAGQVEEGDLGVGELVKRLTEVLIDEPQRNENPQLIEGGAMLVTEYLNKVSEIIPRSWTPSSYHALGHIVRNLQN